MGYPFSRSVFSVQTRISSVVMIVLVSASLEKICPTIAAASFSEIVSHATSALAFRILLMFFWCHISLLFSGEGESEESHLLYCCKYAVATSR